MADPLTQAAQSLAPATASSNLFDPEPGRNVISRYGQARALGDSLQGSLRLSGLARQERLGQAREPMEVMRADEYVAGAGLRERERDVRGMTLDEEEQNRLDRREFEDTRVDVIDGLSSLDPSSPEYPRRRDEFVKNLSGAALEDSVLSDILRVKDRRADQAERLRQDLVKKQAQQEKEIAVLDARLSRDYGVKGVSPEIREKFLLPDGSYDMLGMSYEAGKAAREGKKKDIKEVIDYRTKAGEVLRNQRDFEESAKRSARVDVEAFPRHMEALRASAREASWGKNLTPELLDGQIAARWPEEVAQANRWDEAPYENEFESAKDSTRDEYVNFYPDLPEDKKEKRDILWRAAHKQTGEAPAAEQAVDAPRVDMPGFESEEEAAAEAKVLDADTAGQFLLEAGGDRDKARQLAREAGYEF